MALDKKAAEKSAREIVEQQDQSIKARKNQLFEAIKTDDDGSSGKPFVVYLKDTPAAPMSAPVKAALWAMGVVVVLLFLAAVAGVGR